MKKVKLDMSKFNIDFNSKYLIPMSKLEDRWRKAKDAVTVPCSISLLEDGYTIEAKAPGFHPAYFYVEFFDWQIYRKLFKKEVDN